MKVKLNDFPPQNDELVSGESIDQNCSEQEDADALKNNENFEMIAAAENLNSQDGGDDQAQAVQNNAIMPPQRHQISILSLARISEVQEKFEQDSEDEEEEEEEKRNRFGQVESTANDDEQQA